MKSDRMIGFSSRTYYNADPNILTTFRVAQILKQELLQQQPLTVLLFLMTFTVSHGSTFLLLWLNQNPDDI
jgi:hypothetical protein